MATWAKVGDGSFVLSGEAVYPVVSAETVHSENSCVSGTRRWKTLVGADVVDHRVGSGRECISVYHACVNTV